jgi:hypothetical protein
MASWKKVIADGVALTDIGTPASNDKILIQDTDGNNEVKYVDWGDVGGGGAVTTYTNGTNNYVLTATGSAGINGESNLTFDGTTLDVTGNLFVTGVTGFSSLGAGRVLLTDTHYDDNSTEINAVGEWGIGSRVSTLIGPSSSGLTAGDVYMMGASGWNTASATASVGRFSGLLAVATSTSTGSGMLFEGAIYVGTDPGGSVGDVCYLSTTSGEMTTTVPTASGNVARICGYKIGTNMVYFKPSPDWIKI